MRKRMMQVAFADHYGLKISVGTVSNTEKITADALEKTTDVGCDYLTGGRFPYLNHARDH